MKQIIITILFAPIAMTTWAQNNGLFNEWTETDYSTFEITHEYFTPNGIAPSASGGYDMTGYIPVKGGDVIVFSGDRSPGIPFMMGYTDNEGHGATVLLGDFDANNMDDLRVKDRGITIPAGTAYVRCSARNTSLQGWASRNMSVIKRSLDITERIIRILTVGNSFSADVVESFLYDMAGASGIRLVIGNACRGGYGLRQQWKDIAENISNTDYRKINSDGKYTITLEKSLYEILNDEPWDVITFQQHSQESGMYVTYKPYLQNLINYVKSNAPNPAAKLGFVMTWPYKQGYHSSGYTYYQENQEIMYDSILNVTERIMQEHPDLTFLVPCGTAAQNLRSSFVGDNIDRDGAHLDMYIGRYTAAYTMYATIFGTEEALRNNYIPYCLNEFTTRVAQKSALDAIISPWSFTSQSNPVYAGENTIVPAPININCSPWGNGVPGWNDLGLYYTLTAGLMDTDGNDSGIIVKTIAEFSSGSDCGHSTTDTELNIPSTASVSALWGYNVGEIPGQPPKDFAKLSFQHLNKALAYDFTFFASREYTTDNRETQFTLAGSNTKTVVVDASNNRNKTVTISDIYPDADGNITLTVQAGLNNNSPHRQYYLNAFRISAHSVEQTEVLEQYSGLGLPLINITTADGEEPTSTGIMHPGDLNGASITDVVAKEARMQIYRADTLWYDSGEFIKDEAGIKIKHRGNTSAYYYENKPFKLSLQEKANLIPAEEGDTVNRKSKDWVLLNNAERLRVFFANQMSRLIDMEYTPRLELVNVIINGDYRGIYMLSENVKRDKSCRIDVDKENGYIIELDSYFWNETFSIPSKLTRFLQWTLKYPKPEDLTPEQEADIRSDIARFESSVSAADYPEVMDVHSLARWILLHDIVGTQDPGGSNIYVARKNREPSSLMRMPVVWDMGSSMENLESFSRTHTERGLFFYRLFNNGQCQDFSAAYVSEWERVCQTGAIGKMRQFLQSFPSTELGQGLKRSYPLHTKRWHFSTANVDEMTQNALDWYEGRESWLASQISEMADAVQSIPESDRQGTIRKVIRAGHLYIIKDGETYTIDGKRIKTK